MNIALTGSSGLIGSKLLEDLKCMGHEVLCISSSHSSSQDNIFLYEELQSKRPNFHADFLIHLASINSNLKESEIPQEVDLLKNVINSMETLNCDKIIFFSTIKVYGENSFDSDINLIDESFPHSPECFYGMAKAQCEKTLEKLSHKKNFNYLIFRMPPVLINHPKSNIGKLFHFVEKGFPIPSFRIGDLNQRSFLKYELLTYVLNVILTIDKIPFNKVFNLCDTELISTNDLLKRFGKEINKNPRIIYLPNFIFKIMLRVNRLQLILCRLFGNFQLSNANLKQEFKLPKYF